MDPNWKQALCYARYSLKASARKKQQQHIGIETLTYAKNHLQCYGPKIGVLRIHWAGDQP